MNSPTAMHSKRPWSNSWPSSPQPSPRSFSYRYPVDTRGKPIRLAHELLDLAALANVMEAVSELFTDCEVISAP